MPSIVYGLLGLAVFVQSLGGLTGGSSVISAGLTLGVLVFPIVVITASEAIRAVPQSLRDSSVSSIPRSRNSTSALTMFTSVSRRPSSNPAQIAAVSSRVSPAT